MKTTGRLIEIGNRNQEKWKSSGHHLGFASSLSIVLVFGGINKRKWCRSHRTTSHKPLDILSLSQSIAEGIYMPLNKGKIEERWVHLWLQSEHKQDKTEEKTSRSKVDRASGLYYIDAWLLEHLNNKKNLNKQNKQNQKSYIKPLHPIRWMSCARWRNQEPLQPSASALFYFYFFLFFDFLFLSFTRKLIVKLSACVEKPSSYTQQLAGRLYLLVLWPILLNYPSIIFLVFWWCSRNTLLDGERRRIFPLLSRRRFVLFFPLFFFFFKCALGKKEPLWVEVFQETGRRIKRKRKKKRWE